MHIDVDPSGPDGGLQTIEGPSPERAGASEEEVAGATALIQLSALVQGTFARVADRHGLTPVLGRLLCVLAEEPRNMAELAGVFGVGKASLTGLVERAVQRGLTQRSSVPGDRRVVQVMLTDGGRRAALDFHTDVTRELAAHLAPLGTPGRDAFRAAALTVAHAGGYDGMWGARQAC